MKYFILFVLLFLSQIALKVVNLKPKCFLSQEEDSSTFGFSLAMSDNYLAVGDPDANRIVIYSRTKFTRWVKTKEIVPPTDSITHRVGSGFGYNLALDRDTLVIGAYSQKSDVKNPEDFQWNDPIVSTSGTVYKTKLDANTEVRRIDEFSKGKMSGNVVAADAGKIAFTTSKIEQNQPWNAINQIVVLWDGQKKHLPSPTDNRSGFGADIAIHDNLLLAGSISDTWLFDLEDPKSTVPQTIPTTLNDLVGTTVAISRQFAVVGERSGNRYSELPKTSPKTIIKTISGNRQTSIDGYGELSIDNNLLLRMQYARADINQANILELFHIDDNATPHLLLKRSNIDRALVYNNLLTTVQKKNGRVKLCIEPI